MSGETIVIDPVGMNIVNRVAPGTVLEGNTTWNGGLLVQGTVKGTIKVTGGPLVLMDTGVIAGSILCLGDVFLFGTIEHAGEDKMSKVESSGIAFLAETLRAEADISAARLRFFDGAQVNGRFKTLSAEEQQQLGK